MAKHKKRKLNPHTSRTKPVHQSSQLQKPTKPPPAKKADPTLPFNPTDRILLLGEGDFSFAKSLVQHHRCDKIWASCLDTKTQLFAKYYPQAEQNIQYLESENQNVLYSIDATNLSSTHAPKRGRKFERIIFNFPHVGGKTKDVNRQVRFNQELLVKFFAASMPLLAEDGDGDGGDAATIVVTLFEGEPYSLWNVRDLARHAGLEVRRSFGFVADAYPGYAHSRTLGNLDGGGGWRGEEREARSFVFQRKGVREGGEAKKRRRRDDSEDDEG